MKKYLITSVIILVLSSTRAVLAEDSVSNTSIPPVSTYFFNISEINQLLKDASTSAARKQTQLQNIIKRADDMITARITTLNSLNTRITNDTKLTSSEKTSLTSDVQNGIAGLTSLKATIDADTDITKAIADTKLIVTNYYIYAKLEPKLRLLVTLNNLQTINSNIQTLIPQIQNIISTLSTAGKDVSGLNTLLTDISTQVSAINTTLSTDISLVQGVSAATADPQTVFSQVRQDIAQIVRTDFVKIRTDFAQMRTLFRMLISGGATPAASPASQ